MRARRREDVLRTLDRTLTVLRREARKSRSGFLALGLSHLEKGREYLVYEIATRNKLTWPGGK